MDRTWSRLLCIIIVALLARLWIWEKSPVINPDGALYVWQTQNFLLNGFEGILNSTYPLISAYPAFIAFSSLFFNDIEFSAKFLSVVIGTLTIIPVFLLAYISGGFAVANIISLFFAILPVVAGSNGLIIRDIPCWFFLSWGMYFNIKYFTSRINPVNLIMTSTCYSIAFLFRPEVIVFILVTFIFIVLTNKKHSIRPLLFYSIPILSAVFVGSILAVIHNVSVHQIFSINRIISAILSVTDRYPTIYNELKIVSQTVPSGVVKRLLKEVANFLWLIIPSILIKNFASTLVYVPLVFIALGVLSSLKNRSLVTTYSLILSICVFIIIGFNYMLTGIADGRFFIQLLIAILPVFSGGIISVSNYLKKSKIGEKKVYLVLCLTILFLPATSIIRFSEEDKLVFKEIGQFIQKSSGNEKPRIIGFSTETVTVSYFYAVKGDKSVQNFKGEDGRLHPNLCEYSSFISSIKELRINYIIWDEIHWHQNCFDFLSKITKDGFIILGSWTHRATGKILLVKVPNNLSISGRNL